MKQKITFFTTIIFLFLSQMGISQERYLDEIFSDVDSTQDVAYSFNYSIFPWIAGVVSDTIIIPQEMDIYYPVGDTVSKRPVILFGITGTFFPAYVNGGFVGERSDVGSVEFATRMAKRGYVVGVVQYRRGWLAGSSALNQQRTILHAAYRGIQDMNAAVRYFKENASMWNVDTTRIAAGGHGTGAYVSYGATYLDRYEQTLLAKFIDFSDTANPTPFLDTLLFGDPKGVEPATINNPNHVNHTSDFRVGFGVGGALGDSSWVEAGDVPYISMHSFQDPGQPYNVGDIIAVDGTNGQPFAVIPEGAGGKAVLTRADRLGNQDVFKGVNWADPYNKAAMDNPYNDGAEGLYTFVTPFTAGVDAMCDGIGVPGDTIENWGNPTNYFDSATVVNTWNIVYAAAIAAMPPQRDSGHVVYCQETRGFPNIKSQFDAYMDTVVGYLSPRLAIAMDLPTTTSVDNLIDGSNVSVFPNPSDNRMMIEYVGADAKPITEIKLMDISGRTIRTFNNINTTRFEIMKEDISAGLYLLQIRVGDKFANKKIVFN